MHYLSREHSGSLWNVIEFYGRGQQKLRPLLTKQTPGTWLMGSNGFDRYGSDYCQLQSGHNKSLVYLWTISRDTSGGEHRVVPNHNRPCSEQWLHPLEHSCCPSWHYGGTWRYEHSLQPTYSYIHKPIEGPFLSFSHPCISKKWLRGHLLLDLGLGRALDSNALQWSF